jgi:hypothetical protein
MVAAGMIYLLPVVTVALGIVTTGVAELDAIRPFSL